MNSSTMASPEHKLVRESPAQKKAIASPKASPVKRAIHPSSARDSPKKSQ